MTKTPEQYKAPLKSRTAILGFLADRSYYDRPFRYPLSWNVKVHSFSDEWSDIADVVRSNFVDYVDEWTPEVAEVVKSAYEGLTDEDKSTLYYWALESAQDSVRDDDGYRMLYNEEKTVAEWLFLGRSGGHLCLSEFDGLNMSGVDLEEIEFPTLRRLYRFVVQCDHDFRRDAVKEEMTQQYAFNFVQHHAEKAYDEYKTRQQMNVNGDGI